MCSRNGSGFALIEALVALLVLSVGLLGFAAVQVQGLRSVQTAAFRSQAAFLAYDMSDRMRANAAAVLGGNYDIPVPDTEESDVDAASIPDCVQGICDAGELALFDKGSWLEEVERLLPFGAGTIINVDGLYTITIFWDESRSGISGMNCPRQTNDDLQCVQLLFSL